VQNAHYFRSQAELYFELARRMSLRRDAEYYRVTAERLLSTAVDLEEHPESTSAPSSGAPAIKHR
jgi:hypothetical protein